MTDPVAKFLAVDTSLTHAVTQVRHLLADHPPEHTAATVAHRLPAVLPTPAVYSYLAVAMVRLAVLAAETDTAASLAGDFDG